MDGVKPYNQIELLLLNRVDLGLPLVPHVVDFVNDLHPNLCLFADLWHGTWKRVNNTITIRLNA